MQEIFVSTDIESDGPIPGPNSMLSFGSVAFDESGKEIGSFTRNLQLLEGAVGDPGTMGWWERPEQAAAWAACRLNPSPPETAMREYVAWVKDLPGKPVFVAYPAGFDFLFVYWYMMRFAKESPFSFSALDIKTYAAAVLHLPYREATKRNMPRSWFPKGLPHNHVAIDDAREQGHLFMAMRRANLKRGSSKSLAPRTGLPGSLFREASGDVLLGR